MPVGPSERLGRPMRNGPLRAGQVRCLPDCQAGHGVAPARLRRTGRLRAFPARCQHQCLVGRNREWPGAVSGAGKGNPGRATLMTALRRAVPVLSRTALLTRAAASRSDATGAAVQRRLRCHDHLRDCCARTYDRASLTGRARRRLPRRPSRSPSVLRQPRRSASWPASSRTVRVSGRLSQPRFSTVATPPVSSRTSSGSRGAGP
jgi:hypothetical protein